MTTKNIDQQELDKLLNTLSEKLNCKIVNISNVDEAIKQQVSISRVIDNSKIYSKDERQKQKAIYELAHIG